MDCPEACKRSSSPLLNTMVYCEKSSLGNKLSVQAKAENGKVFKNDVADRITARYMVKNSEDEQIIACYNWHFAHV